MKRLICFALALCVCAILSACAANADAEWLEESAADKLALNCTISVNQGKLSSAQYAVAGDSGHKSYVYIADQGLEEGETPSYSSMDDPSLTMEDIKEIVDNIMLWVPENLPERADYFGISYALPRRTLWDGWEEIGTGYVYSLGTKEITALDGPYTGTQKYGSVWLAALYDSIVPVYICD